MFDYQAEELAKKKALAGAQAPGIGDSFVDSLNKFKTDSSEFISDGVDSFKSGVDQAKAIGADTGLTGKSTQGVAAKGLGEYIETGDKGAAMNTVVVGGATAIGTAYAGPIGGMLAGAAASALMPKPSKGFEDPEKAHLI